MNYFNRQIRLFTGAIGRLFLLLPLLLAGCATTKVPMDERWYPGLQSSGDTLVIALRGLGGSVDDFEKYGFVNALQSAYPSIDLVCPDAHYGYYRERSVVQRLYNDVILPARKKGYRSIYLVGVSLGGLGTLLELREHQDDFAGVVLLSPYTGEPEVHAAIESYLDNEAPAPWRNSDVSDYDRDFYALWRWMIEHETLLDSGKIWLGYGEQDRLSGHELLASLLPVDRVIHQPGKHRAEVFVEIWKAILSKRPFTPGQ